ncbi:MAG: acetyl-CoA C-acyltransferase [Desulfuromonas sp.]|nr:MAG: acetyl-CoA C-acyltransferase [Desulfuromonas sp.]
MSTAYILNVKRTPGGKAPRGQLRNVRPDDLAATVIRSLIEESDIDPALLDDVIMGCAFPEAEQGMNVARIAALRAGVPVEVPAMTINRFCSSGLQAIVLAAERILAGQADCIIAGGTESMSMIPMGGHKFSANPQLVSDWPESYAAMGITAENLADRYGIDREDQDRFAVRSHHLAATAQAQGRFAGEIVPVCATGMQGVVVDRDEGVRPETTILTLAKLQPVFRRGGTVTAGNSSQTTDGAAAAIIVSETFLKRLSYPPLARFASFAIRGVAPEIMGIGPVEAVPVALKKAGIAQKDLGLIELNEAFSVQALAVMRDLDCNEDLVNVNGGAIALGHPLGATGAKLTATLLTEMRRRQVRYGMVTMCIGGGMGAAGIFEAC